MQEEILEELKNIHTLLKFFLTNNDQYYANNLHEEILSMANNIDQIKNEMQQIKQFVNR